MEQYITETSFQGSHTATVERTPKQKEKQGNSGFSALLARSSDKMKNDSETKTIPHPKKSGGFKKKSLQSPKIKILSPEEKIARLLLKGKKETSRSEENTQKLLNTKGNVPQIAKKDETNKIRFRKKDNSKEALLTPINSEKQNSIPAAILTSVKNRQKSINSKQGQKEARVSLPEVEAASNENLPKGTRVEIVDRRSINSLIENIRGNRQAEQFTAEDIRQEVKVSKGRGSKNHRNTLRKIINEKVEPELVQEEQNTRIRETEISLSPKQETKNVPRNIATALAQKIAGQEGNEIIRLVRVVLNNSDSGEVHINLRPDNLGRIRMKILLDKNRLTGQIFVDSVVAREAMRASISSLQDRLIESGFSSVDLDLTWDGSSENNNPRKHAESKQNLFTDMKEVEDIINGTIMESSGERINITV